MDSLNVESATHPYPCQVTTKTVYGEVKFVYMFADGQTVGDVEMLLANYLKDYLPSDVDFKENYAPRLPRSFLQPWEPLRPYGNEFGEVKLLLASIINVINEIVKIVADVKDNPTVPVSSWSGAIPVSKKATILVSTMAISTRPEQHIEFITEQGERLEKLDHILRMTVIARKIPCLNMLFTLSIKTTRTSLHAILFANSCKAFCKFPQNLLQIPTKPFANARKTFCKIPQKPLK